MCLWMVGMTLLLHLKMLLGTNAMPGHALQNRATNSTSAPIDVTIGLELIVNATLELGCEGFAKYLMFWTSKGT